MPGARPGRARLARRACGIGLLFCFFALRFFGGFIALWLGARGRERRRAWFGRCLLDLFRALGATFIKIGQIMSTRPDLLPEYVTGALARLQDDVGPFPFEDARRTIEEDLRRPLAEVFAEMAPAPLASASVAQVHKARLRDGRVVAVKVRRPDVVRLCTFDLAVVGIAARVLGVLPGFRPLDPAGAAADFGRAVFAQLDFRIEAANNARFRHNFRDDPDVVFPDIVESLSSERILVMSFADGNKITSRIPADGASPAAVREAARIARVGMRALLKMVFRDGFVHADLHPGNVLVTSGGKLVMLDVGLVGELDESRRLAFSRFFTAWVKRDGDGMARLLLQMSGNVPDPEDDAYQRFRSAIIEFVGRYWGQRLGQVQVGRVLLDLTAILRRHRVRMNPTFTTVNIAIAVTEGIGKQLDPGLDLMVEALPFFVDLESRADRIA